MMATGAVLMFEDRVSDGERGIRVFDLHSINRAQVARLAGCHITHVSRVLNGYRTPSLPMAKAIADVLGVTLDELWYNLFEVKR
jgi:transcriptional regulator with XRE-family HTH domain